MWQLSHCIDFQPIAGIELFYLHIISGNLISSKEIKNRIMIKKLNLVSLYDYLFSFILVIFIWPLLLFIYVVILFDIGFIPLDFIELSNSAGFFRIKFMSIIDQSFLFF